MFKLCFPGKECKKKDALLVKYKQTTARANRLLKQKVRRLESRCAKLEDEAVRAKKAKTDKNNLDILQLQRTKGGKQLTVQGGIALAIRRNYGHCAAADVGAMLLESISRWTVTRQEVRAGAALIASSRIYFHWLYTELTSSAVGSTYKVVFHSWRQDATNSGILKGGKVCALILHSAFLRENVAFDPGNGIDSKKGFVGSDFDFDCADAFVFDEHFESHVRVSDVLPVHGATSEITASQTLKQLEGLGCITWKDVQKNIALQRSFALNW